MLKVVEKKTEIPHHKNFVVFILHFVNKYLLIIIFVLIANLLIYTQNVISNIVFDNILKNLKDFYNLKIQFSILKESLNQLVIVWVIYAIAYRIIFFVSSYLYANMEREIRLYIFKTIQKFHSIYNFSSTPIEGQITNSIGEMADGATEIIEKILNNFIPTIGLLIFTSIVIIKRVFTIGLLITIWYIIHIIFNFFLIKKSLYYSSKLQKYQNILNGELMDSLLHINTTKIFDRLKEEYSYILTHHNNEYNAHKNMLYFTGLIKTLLDINLFVFMGLIFSVYIPKMCFSKLINEFDIVFILLNIYNILTNTYRMTNELKSIIEGFGQCSQSMFLLPKYYINDSEDKKDQEVYIDSIEFVNVNLKMNGKKILDNISFKIEKNEKLIFIGSTGSGKTTILKCLMGIINDYEGNIFINNNNIKKIKNLKDFFVFIDQKTSIFSRTIRENILYGKPNATNQDIIEASANANIHNFIKLLPKQYETIITNKNLSGGQVQRICLARGFIKNSPCMLMDEPTNGLDVENQKILIDYITHQSDKCCIFIEHNLNYLHIFDKIFVLREGKIVNKGNYQEIINNPELKYFFSSF
ncbi:hypothetical protein AB836_01730 [Rickettsiales bacterium (ex Bugula neritina AB1)]|nr:hypothetical protein AB836_01730 [Rickettsiales bacterium (ex Bugula neritina AB1)]